MQFESLINNQTFSLKSIHDKEGVGSFLKRYPIYKSKGSLECLEEILIQFSNLPYENLSKIIKHHRESDDLKKIRLPVELMEDHLAYHFGGTCFSLTFLLQNILTYHDFRCYPVMADMRWGENVHCVLIVVINNLKYLVDPGYLLTTPMIIQPRRSVIHYSEVSGVELKFIESEERYHLSTFNHHEKKWRYRFLDRSVSENDFLKFWFSSFHWNSMHGLCLTKIEKDRMIYIHKTFMRETTFSDKKNFNIKKTYHNTIQKIFSIDPPIIEEALASLEANMRRERELGLWVPKKADNHD